METLITVLRRAVKLRSVKALMPYIAKAWEQSLAEANLLSKYPTIPNGLRYGFHAGLPNLSLLYYSCNSPLVEEHKSTFDDIINKELSKG